MIKDYGSKITIGTKNNSKTIDLPIATNNSIELINAATEALKAIYKYGYLY